MEMAYKFLSSKFSQNPGVYLMRGKAGEVLYVGKAKNLRKRLASYFVKRDQTPKTLALVERIYKIDTIAVKTELEALILENEQIKRFRPPFNIVMRDDKGYLYIRITVHEEYPRILLARRVAKDGAKYFGPYAVAGRGYEVLKLINRSFPLCTGTPGTGRACMNYHLKICPGVCLGKVGAKEYRATIAQVVKFLQGNFPAVIKELRAEMAHLAADKKFERAARLRDGLKAIGAINESQNVVRANLGVSEDIIGIARQLNKALVVLLQVRSGALINQQQYALDTKYETDNKDILSGFLRDYYTDAADLPKTILLPEEVEGAGAFDKWLTSLAGRRIELVVPMRGRGRALVRLANSNAGMKFNQISSRWQLEKVIATEGVDWLRKKLKLKKLERIEAYDISNLQGTDSVGAMVVWEKGQMDKTQYRRFKIKSVVGPNDFASLAEVLKRRFAHMAGDEKFARLPDIVLIDGGKGQVGTITKALKDFKVAVIGIAKGSHSRTKAKDDLVLTSGVVILPDNSPTKMLLQNIRDEVHRFAIAYHTGLRKKRTTSSGLEKIAGIGAVTRKKLIKAFGSMAAVKAASQAKLAKIVGEKTAEKIVSGL